VKAIPETRRAHKIRYLRFNRNVPFCCTDVIYVLHTKYHGQQEFDVFIFLGQFDEKEN
jgi:hypothetical protein